ncbi:MAG: Mur ligase family protein, partial [Ilumatobacteraceae bacterium]
MASLQNILYTVNIRSTTGNAVESVNDLQIDSRKVTAGSCFIAIKGSNADGHNYIDVAITSGATVIICQQLPPNTQVNVMYVEVENSSVAAGILAHNFYGQSSHKIKLIGVTGTNGKTTVATLLFNLFSAIGYKCGLISTVQNQIADQILPSTHTTPDAVSVNELLAKMVN